MTFPTVETQTAQQRAMTKGLRDHWKQFLFQGILHVILGGFAVAAPVAATVAVDIYIGWIFLISGVMGFVAMFYSQNVGTVLWALVAALLSLIVGAILIWQPVQGAYSLTIVLPAFFVIEGIFQIAGAFNYRDVITNTWGWMIASGAADLALAAIIISGWPSSASWTLGIIVGINLITSGAALVFTALAGRDVIAHATA
jgi:uncharacterized membrane protein HdeD (DUF308 family)